MKLLDSLLLIFPFFIFPFSFVYADYGCHFEVNARLSTPLDNSDKKISFRFTCQEDINVIGLSFYCEQSRTPPAYLVSLYEDQNGKPSSHSLGSSSVTPKEKSWITIPLDEVPLTGGKVYHLVIEQDINRGGDHRVGIIGPQNFASFAYTDVLNSFNPRDEKPDPQVNVLFFEKGKWRELNREPLYALHGTGQHLQGNPYDDYRARPIHGNGNPRDRSHDVLQGEALHPHSGFYPTGFVIRIRKNGNPPTALNYRVYAIDFLNHKTSMTFSGEALKPHQVSSSFQWVTIGLNRQDGPKDFPPECRYVVFQSDSGRPTTTPPGCEDCYLLSDVGNSGGLSGAADMSFDGGAHLSRAVFSPDGWTTWIDEFERDSNVVILGPPASISEAKSVEPIPTPLPFLWFSMP